MGIGLRHRFVDVDAVVEAAVEAHTPGILLGSTALASTFSPTSNQDITGLSVGPIVGQGRPVEIQFYCPLVAHTVLSTLLRAEIKSNGVGIQRGWDVNSSIAANAGRALRVVHPDYMLTNGVNYTFTVGVFQGTAGTMTWFAAANALMKLSVVSR